MKLVGLILLFCSVGWSSRGQNQNNSIDLTDSMAYVADVEQKLTPLHVATLDFFHLAKSKPELVSPGWLWTKLAIKPNDAFVLSVPQPMVNVDFYLIDAGAVAEQQLFKVHQRNEGGTRFPVLVVNPSSHARTLVLAIHWEGIPTPIKIIRSDERTFWLGESWNIAFLWFTFGTLGIMMIYNTVLFMALGDRSLGWYVLYLLSVIAVNLSGSGIIKMLYPLPSEHWYWLFIFIVSFVGHLSLIKFCDTFLDLKARFRPAHVMARVLVLLNFSFLVSAIAGRMDYATASLQFMAVVNLLFVLVTPVIVYRRGYSPAFLFSLGSVAGVSGIIIFLLKDLYLLPFNFFTTNAIQIGTTLDSVLFAFALGYRINRAQKEKIQAAETGQQKLQEKVDERTAELRTINTNLEKIVSERIEEISISNEQLEQANISLEKANAKLDDFIYRSYHDLRGPLARLKGVCTIGQLDSVSPLEKEYFDVLNQQCNGLLRIFSKLMVSHQLESMEQPDAETLNFKELLEETLEQLKEDYAGLAAYRAIAVQGDGTFLANVYCVKAMLQNVVENALLFANKQHPVVTIAYEKLPGASAIRVADNGQGISENVAAQMFDRNYRGASESNGAGLGLYIAALAANKSDATITYTREEGLTVFTIRLNDHDR
jgi:signal transduction histidine kinase